MDNMTKMILLAVGILITIGVATFSFVLFFQSKGTAEAGAGQMTKISREFQDADITVYDGMTVTGKDVEKAITKFGADLNDTFIITVKTILKPTGTPYSKKPTSSPAKGAADYINPVGVFKGSIEYDDNQVVKGLVFTQQK